MARKIILAFLSLIFLLFSYFQINDPDSMRWVVYYLLLAILGILSILGRNRQIYMVLMMTFSLIGLVYYFPGFWEWMQDGMPSIVSSMKAESPYIEVVREFLGLSISFVFLVFLFVGQKKAHRTAENN